MFNFFFDVWLWTLQVTSLWIPRAHSNLVPRGLLASVFECSILVQHYLCSIVTPGSYWVHTTQWGPQCDQCLSKVKKKNQSNLSVKNASGLFISPCKMWCITCFALWFIRIIQMHFWIKYAVNPYTPMPNRVEKREQTGKCFDESRLFLKTLLFSPANIENPVKIAA